MAHWALSSLCWKNCHGRNCRHVVIGPSVLVGFKPIYTRRAALSFPSFFFFLVQGLPSSPPRLLYTLPLSSPVLSGTFFFMTPTNRAVVQRTWGLHELDARRMIARTYNNINSNDSAHASGNQSLLAERQRRTYGRQFKYDEFLVMSSAVSAVAFGVAFALGAMALAFIPPVCIFPFS